MHKVKLLTNTFLFVAEVELPPFVIMPEVLIWGQRFFKQASEDTYTEVFAYAVMVES